MEAVQTGRTKSMDFYGHFFFKQFSPLPQYFSKFPKEHKIEKIGQGAPITGSFSIISTPTHTHIHTQIHWKHCLDTFQNVKSSMQAQPDGYKHSAEDVREALGWEMVQHYHIYCCYRCIYCCIYGSDRP